MKKQVRSILSIAALIAAFSVFLVACGGGPAKINATLTDYEIVLSASTAKAGEITFHVQNNADATVHEFVVVQTDTAAADLPVGADLLVDESQFTPIDEIEDLEAGDSADLTVTLAAGHYVILCNIAGHYQLGMHTDFNVTP